VHVKYQTSVSLKHHASSHQPRYPAVT